ncbi:cholesterol esterase [Streptomyces maremycinicus]|nr:cholesterol esterase [Streptomyces sp. B9173]
MASSPDVTSSADNTPENPESGSTTRRGRVRPRRAAVMAVPATLVAAGLAVLTAQGALGVQFAISGMPFVVTADRLDGEGFAQFGGLDNMIENSPNQGDTGGQVLVVTSVVKNGKITNMCQSVDLGGIQLVLRAGGGSTPVSVKNLAIDSDEISGDAEFNNIEIGRDSSTFDKVPIQGPAGVYGQQADTVVIKNLYQHNYAATAAVFKLPGLKMSFSGEGCK